MRFKTSVPCRITLRCSRCQGQQANDGSTFNSTTRPSPERAGPAALRRKRTFFEASFAEMTRCAARFWRVLLIFGSLS